MRRLLVSAAIVSIVILVYGGIHFYLYRRAVSSLDIKSQGWLWALRATIVFLASAYIAARLLVHLDINPFSVAMYWIGSIWWGLSLYLFIFSLLAQFVSGIVRLVGLDNPAIRTASAHFGTAGFIVVLSVSILLSALGFYRAQCTAETTHIEVPIKSLPDKLEGFTIVQISDLHLDFMVSAGWVRRIVERVNSLDPDIVVITGDLADEDPSELGEVFTTLGKLNARHGVFAVSGNHEFYTGLRKVIRGAKTVGVRYLRDEAVVIDGELFLYGIDDPTIERLSGERIPFEEIIGPEAKDHLAILLYHRSTRFRPAAKLGIDLMLSGHTHNGQLWPLGYIVRLQYPRLTGHFREGSSHLYVTRGTGTWGPPIRLGSQPEIVRIVLSRDKKG